MLENAQKRLIDDDGEDVGDRFADPDPPEDEQEGRLNFWRLCDEVSVLQAAALIADVDPSTTVGAYCDAWPIDQQPRGFTAAKAALVHAIKAGRLAATVRHQAREYAAVREIAGNFDPGVGYLTRTGAPLEHDERLSPDEPSPHQTFAYRITPDWGLTTIRVDELRKWLASRGFKTGFFFPQEDAAPSFLDAKHPRYAPKLAATVSAWLAVDDTPGKHPKQALMKWLRENCARFALSDDDGKANELGIEECAKVANWRPGGGAPKTPGG